MLAKENKNLGTSAGTTAEPQAGAWRRRLANSMLSVLLPFNPTNLNDH